MRVLDACNRLAVYTVNITDNPKKFNPIHARLIGRISGEASEIYHHARAANLVKVENSETRCTRRTAQKRAIQLCDLLATDICVAKGVFHLSARRVKHWTKMVDEAEELLKAWVSSDDKRYAQYKL